MKCLSLCLFSALSCLLLSCTSLCSAQGSDKIYTIVTHLGNDFILPDGCPTRECQSGDRVCRREVSRILQQYDQCISNGFGEFHGCVTDLIETKERLTLPIYANFCSGYCYEKNPKDLKRLERCPFQGERHHDELDPALLRTLLN